MKHPILLLLFLILLSPLPATAQQANAILGNWKAEEKILTIQIYKKGNEYRGKIIHYKDRHHPERDPEKQLDTNNPDPDRRRRQLIGMDVLTGMKYRAESKTWEGGIIYNPGNGKSYSARMKLNSSGKLEVRAFMGVSLIGRTMVFRK